MSDNSGNSSKGVKRKMSMTSQAKSVEYVDFAAIDAALQRAAKAAHALARRTKTPCYIWKDGVIVDLMVTRSERQEKQAG